MKVFRWLKHRLSHKLGHFSSKKIKQFLKENGLAFVIIFIGWEIVEDVVFPVVFAALGGYIHPAFYAGIPASIFMCFHWLAVPVLWGIWLKLNKKSNDVEIDCCEENKK